MLILNFYEQSEIRDEDGVKYDMRTILICPTASSGANEIYKILKSLEYLIFNVVYVMYVAVFICKENKFFGKMDL